ncbi:hypothetical protein AgCh_017357 [Apium graveolens]
MKILNIHSFYEALDQEILSVSVSAMKIGWRMYVAIMQMGSLIVSSKAFQKLRIVELYVLQRKVIQGSNKVNELMRDFIDSQVKDIGAEAYLDPPVVKYHKPGFLHNLTLTDECLKQANPGYLTYIEGILRCKKNRSREDLDAAELIYAFRLNHASYSKSELKRTMRYYLKSVMILNAEKGMIPEDI